MAGPYGGALVAAAAALVLAAALVATAALVGAVAGRRSREAFGVVAYVGANCCGCKTLKPHWRAAQAASDDPDAFRVVDTRTDAGRKEAEAAGVQRFPMVRDDKGREFGCAPTAANLLKFANPECKTRDGKTVCSCVLSDERVKKRDLDAAEAKMCKPKKKK